MTSLDGYSYIENFITKSGIVWKSVRRRWIQLLVEVGLKNPKNKIPLSMLYLKHYRTLMTDYLGTIFNNYMLNTYYKIKIKSGDCLKSVKWNNFETDQKSVFLCKNKNYMSCRNVAQRMTILLPHPECY